MEISERIVVGARRVRLAVYERNRGAEETVVLIHGYPDNHRVWDPVADLLADRFHVVTYDVRGAGGSDAPTAVVEYALPLLVEDAAAVIAGTAPDGRRVHLVGHDWGSIQGWHVVCDPEASRRVATYTSISGPHLDAVGMFMRRRTPNPPSIGALVKQGLKSWYVAAFQIPGLAPALWRTRYMRAAWPKMLHGVEKVPAEYVPSGRELDRSQSDGANGVKLYRANMFRRLGRPVPAHTGVPVQVLVPRGDRYVSPALAECTAGLGDVVYHHLDGGHWIVLADPGRVASLIVEHIERGARVAGAVGVDAE